MGVGPAPGATRAEARAPWLVGKKDVHVDTTKAATRPGKDRGESAGRLAPTPFDLLVPIRFPLGSFTGF